MPGKHLGNIIQTIAVGSVKMRQVTLRFDCPACNGANAFSKVEGVILAMARSQMGRPNFEIYQCNECATIIGTDFKLPVEAHHVEVTQVSG